MKSIVFCYILLTASLIASSQNEAKATRTSGTCSPIVTGGSSQITIRCSGLSNEKANQMIVLMNKILAEHLDLTEVNSKLDGMGSQLDDINTTLNPLSGAPVEVVKLYEESQTLMTSCQNMVMEWSRASQDGMLERSRKQLEDMSGAPAKLTANRNALQARKQEEYRSKLMPRLVELDAKLREVMQLPNVRPDEYAQAPAFFRVTTYGTRIKDFAKHYETHQTLHGLPIDPSIQKTAQELANDCQSFAQTWQSEELGLNVSSQPSYHLASAITPGDIAEAQKYHTTLGPQLISWRSRALTYIPRYSTAVDYGNVSTVRNLADVCMDLMQMQAAYQQKRKNELLEKRALPAGTR